VLELTGKKAPRDGLQGKFSVYHGCAVGLIHGRAGEEEFSDAMVNDARVIALRDRVQAVADEGIPEESVHLDALLWDGRHITLQVEHAIGSLNNALSDAQLDAKFNSLAAPVIGSTRAGQVIKACRALATLPNLRDLATLMTPEA
jgi:2-methylcitrate dehydratase PrpD